MTALHLVCAILVCGGYGEWQVFLKTSVAYVSEERVRLRPVVGGLEALEWLSEKKALIVKITVWFAVLAGVTTGKKPLLEVVRWLFRPGQSSLPEAPPIAGSMERTSMIFLMGCENKVIWACAEIFALSTWKQEQKESGRLSVEVLVQRAEDIEKELEVKEHYPAKILSDFKNDLVAYSRYLVAHIFRASAMLYLHSVVLDGHPHVAQIKTAVDEVMRWICNIPKKPQSVVDKQIHKLAVRSTVLAFYITGALTDDVECRKELSEYLLTEAEGVGGNCGVVARVLEEIWADRESAKGGAEVLWREKLYHGNEPILLV
ncbi:hypothetical protein P691DRAFT_723089 [Macrolepiota fuliginosa MF-IS2]|uniref:Uncharacterized protein n=1 Tax=Macrolepiota fuliginosa MF-IS2 TaxID=1400762 RepID=A0A9P5XJ79_9AGAR|nr:hypothetical protein P691DRAFT_723089 [Macrolepiota fuliginosa MF-IS2]